MKKPVVVDCEYREVDGRLEVLCVVAQCLQTGRVWKQWLGGVSSPSPSFPCGSDVILVAHAVAPAEARCMLALAWDFPGGWIDTYAEERVLARGSKPDEGFRLLACCRQRGIQVIADYQKSDMQKLCCRPGDHDLDERRQILDYCETDVTAEVQLYSKISDFIDLPQALLRGQYLAECARIAERGLPVDKSRLKPLLALGNAGLRQLFADHFDDHGILTHGSLNRLRFEELVMQSGIYWPLTDGGHLKTDKDTLKEIARIHGEPWEGIRQLLRVTGGASVDALTLRDDGRLLADLHPFGTLTGRCTPSTSAFLWNGPKWLRFLLQPPPGRTLLVLDWSNQEFAIAAALSQDPAMMAAYASGDPYLALAKQAKKVPDHATADSHPKERSQFKVVSLAVLMGMSAWGIGRRLNTGESHGRELLEMHKRIYHIFWKWSDAASYTAGANRPLETAFGLVYQPGEDFKPRTARIFLLQATGSDMLRVAVLLLASQGIKVISTIHDSVVVECDTCEAVEISRLASDTMREASRITLWNRLEVRTDVKQVDHPFHYQDDKGRDYWMRLAALLDLPLDDHGG